ncbi:hypothetical protein [Ferroacidibacillus organovorans]|uniref:hypothetical protein n=1 Tax=Ferroacidibacillus organovorans TaxID=1765683 RepID=UPI00128F8E3D|nr:hypothetical protein [Ferroacidibacillus organovorans]
MKTILNKKSLSIFLYILIALIFMGDVTLHPLTTYIGQPGDAQQFMWYLGHFWNSLLQGRNPFVSTSMNYPNGINLMANTSLIAESAIFGPIALVTNLVLVYNLLFLLNFIATSVFSELIFRDLGISRFLAVAGAVLIAILPYYMAQDMGHLNLVLTSPLWVVLYMVVHIVTKGTIRPKLNGVVIGVLLAIEFYTSLEIFVTFLMVSALLLIVSILITRNKFNGYMKKIPRQSVIYGISVLLGLAIPGIVEYLFGPYRPPLGLSVQSPNIYVTDLLSLIIPSPVYLIHSHTTTFVTQFFSGNYSENDGYIGIPAIILFVWSVQRTWSRSVTKVVFTLVLIIAIFSFGPYLHILGNTSKIMLPWIIFQGLPILKDILPGRLMMYSEIGIVLILLIGAEDVISKRQKTRSTSFIMVFFLCLTGLTWWPRMPYWTTNVNPTLTSALSSGGSLYRSLKSQVVGVVSSDFPINMETIADSGYPFSTANVYAFTSTNENPMNLLNISLFATNGSSVTVSQVRNSLRAYLPYAHVSRLLFMPISVGEKISPTIYNGITDILGQPIKQVDGACEWIVPFSFNSRMVIQQFSDLYNASTRYLVNNKWNTSNLYPLALEKLGFLSPSYQGYSKNEANFNWTGLGGWVGAWGNNQFAVGLNTTAKYAEQIIRSYQHKSVKVYYPYPQVYNSSEVKRNWGTLNNTLQQLLIVFNAK